MKYVLRVKVCFSIFALFAAFNAKITRHNLWFSTEIAEVYNGVLCKIEMIFL